MNCLIGIIVSMTNDRVIGIDGGLPWSLPKDMEFFKKTTLGCKVIMGRKTYESLPAKSRPLAGRHNIVLTRNTSYTINKARNYTDSTSCEVAFSLFDAIASARARDKKPVYIIGGEEVYKQAMDSLGVDLIYITRIDTRLKGDAYFPSYNVDFPEWDYRIQLTVNKDEHHDHSFLTTKYIRR